MEDTRTVEAFVGMGAEVVALGLGKIGRKTRAAVGVEISQRSAQSRDRDARGYRSLNHAAPAVLPLGNRSPEIVVEQQVRQLGIPAEGGSYIVEKDGADNTAGAPDRRDRAEVKPVVIRLRRRAEQCHPLGIGAYFRSIECSAYRRNERIAVECNGLDRTSEHRCSRLAL